MIKRTLNRLASRLGFVRRERLDAMTTRFSKLRASYDAARTTDEFSNYWANADRFDADSAHSKEVRHTLMSRSRYEIASNGYADGIASTSATDLIGVGPTLRMQTGSQAFNQMVEMQWYLWTQAVHFRRKLWCLAHAKHVDGECFAVMARNPNVNHALPLDLKLYEADQVQTPYLPFLERGYIDGIKFDEFGNPVWYDILRDHPGATNTYGLNLTPERVQAKFVLHWFKMRRPGQHRGVPEMASTLNTGAASRRWREATIAAAESAADFTTLLKTQFQPDEVDQVTPLSTVDIQKRMMVALPQGWDATQMKAEHPNANYEAFHKTLINEQARPKSMPFNKAACDSSSYNYASGRLDHQTYYAALDVEREDCNDLVLNPLFDAWFDMAIRRFGWLGGNAEAVGPGARVHLWDWPKHRVADVEAEANAFKTRLVSGLATLSGLYADEGKDFEDELMVMTKDYYGDTSPENVLEMRKALRTALLNISNQQAGYLLAENQAKKTAAEAAQIRESDQPSSVTAQLLSKLNRNGHTNGVSHAH